VANLLISGVCNLRCPYCFAGHHLAEYRRRADSPFIALDVFEDRLDFLDRSGINEIRLIGGEPTLHPQFPEIIRRAAQRGKHIVVFSHGLMPERAAASLEALPVGRCTVLVNTNAARSPDGPGPKEHARRLAVLRRLGARAFPGFNIYAPDCSLDFLLPLVLETGCRKTIRLGLAAPTAGGDNVYLHPKQYPFVGAKIVRFARQAARSGIRVEFDCGFVRCMFSEADLDTLREAGADVGWRCSPVLDIDVTGQAVHCFPLANLAALPLDHAGTAGALRDELAARMQPYRAAGIYKTCSTCRRKQNGECTGGCLAVTMRRFRHEPIRIVVPQAETRAPADAPDVMMA
jgi:hypothetical protein